MRAFSECEFFHDKGIFGVIAEPEMSIAAASKEALVFDAAALLRAGLPGFFGGCDEAFSGKSGPKKSSPQGAGTRQSGSCR